MKFGLDVPTTGAYADPRLLAQLATEAEAAGWDGACHAYLQSQRTADTPFDVVMSGEAPGDLEEAREMLGALQNAGATWWLEEGLGWSLDDFRERIRNGPPAR